MILCNLFFLAFSAVSSTFQAEQNNEQKNAWRLVWQDEFTYGNMPDPQKWNYEIGFVRNEEAQFYRRAAFANTRIENGRLIIEALKGHHKNPSYKAGSKDWKKSREFVEYTSASLTTKNLASWKYGRIEVRAKIPTGKGAWPAIWMLGVNRPWPWGGEIDIMENIGCSPNEIHATVHYAKPGGAWNEHASNGNTLVTENPHDDFHVYSVEWDEEKMNFFFDDQLYHTFILDEAGEGDSNPFRQPFYLIINLALGGSWGGEIDDSIFPLRYYVDYVRVYQRLK